MADTYHKWVVLVAAFLVAWLSFGFAFQFGVFFLPILNTYQESRSQTALVQALLMGFSLCFGACTGFLDARFGYAKVFLVGAVMVPSGVLLSCIGGSIFTLQLCVGLVTGIGINLTYISSAVAIGKVFNGSTKLLALSLHTAACSVAGVTHPIVIRKVLDNYGLNGSLLLIGGIFLNNMAAAIVFWYSENDIQHIESTEKKINLLEEVANGTLTTMAEDKVLLPDIRAEVNETATNRQLIEHRINEREVEEASIRDKLGRMIKLKYIFFVVGTAVCLSPMNGYQSLVLDIFVWKGFTEQQGILSYLPFNVMGIIGRCLPGIIKQKRGINSLTIPLAFALCGLIGVIVILSAVQYFTMIAGVALAGFGLGGLVASGSVVVSKIVPEDCFSIGVGIVYTTAGLMTSVAGPTFGAMRDELKTYSHVLVVSASMLGTGAALFLSSMYIRNRDRQRDKDISQRQI